MTPLLRESWSELPAPEAGTGTPLPALAVKLPWAPSGHVATRPLTQLVSPPDWGTATVRSLLEAVLALQGLGTDLSPRTPAGPAIRPSLILGSLGEL